MRENAAPVERYRPAGFRQQLRNLPREKHDRRYCAKNSF
jgi:hypothetical protein